MCENAQASRLFFRLYLLFAFLLARDGVGEVVHQARPSVGRGLFERPLADGLADYYKQHRADRHAEQRARDASEVAAYDDRDEDEHARETDGLADDARIDERALDLLKDEDEDDEDWVTEEEAEEAI